MRDNLAEADSSLVFHYDWGCTISQTLSIDEVSLLLMLSHYSGTGYMEWNYLFLKACLSLTQVTLQENLSCFWIAVRPWVNLSPKEIVGWHEWCIHSVLRSELRFWAMSGISAEQLQGASLALEIGTIFMSLDITISNTRNLWSVSVNSVHMTTSRTRSHLYESSLVLPCTTMY